MDRRSALALISGLVSAAVPLAAAADPRTRVLILDGYSNHDWRLTTALIRGMLEPSGLFAVDVATAPPTADAPGWDSLAAGVLELRRRHPDLQRPRRRPAVAAPRAGGLRGLRPQRRRRLCLARRQQRLPRLARVQRDDRPRLAQEGLRPGDCGRGERHPPPLPCRRRAGYRARRPHRHRRPSPRRPPDPHRPAAGVADARHRGLLLRPRSGRSVSRCCRTASIRRPR